MSNIASEFALLFFSKLLLKNSPDLYKHFAISSGFRLMAE
jgi:hypothetical protein